MLVRTVVKAFSLVTMPTPYWPEIKHHPTSFHHILCENVFIRGEIHPKMLTNSLKTHVWCNFYVCLLHKWGPWNVSTCSIWMKDREAYSPEVVTIHPNSVIWYWNCDILVSTKYFLPWAFPWANIQEWSHNNMLAESSWCNMITSYDIVSEPNTIFGFKLHKFKFYILFVYIKVK